MSGHTEGKWEVLPHLVGTSFCIYGPGEYLICEVSNYNERLTNEANARLIAAAPCQHEAGREIDRLMLVILSAVKADQPAQYNAVAAALLANRAAITRATSPESPAR